PDWRLRLVRLDVEPQPHRHPHAGGQVTLPHPSDRAALAVDLRHARVRHVRPHLRGDSPEGANELARWERPGHTRRCATVASVRTWRGSRPRVVPTTSCLQSSAERVGFEPTIPFQIYTRSRRAPSAARPPLQRAESVGFEPTVPLPVRLISSQVPSTTRPALQ